MSPTQRSLQHLREDDHLELGRPAKGWVKWLCGVVAILAYCHLAIIDPVYAAPHVAKVTDLFTIKRISVTEISVNKKCMTPCVDFIAVVQQLKLGTNLKSVSWRDHSYASLIESRLFFEFGGKRESLGVHANPIPDVVGGSLSEVLRRDVDIYPPAFRLWAIDNFSVKHHHVSAQLPFGGALGSFNQFIGRAPQFVSKASQDTRNDYKQKSYSGGQARIFGKRSLDFFFFFLLFSIAFRFLGSLGGYISLDNQRGFFGAAIVLSSWLILGLGL
jgi:hypothetical protein